MPRTNRAPRKSRSPVVIERVEARLLLSTSLPTSQESAIYARYETAPVSHGGDAADDIAIWAGGAGAVIGTDKQGALNVYDLQGRFLSAVSGGDYNGVDLRSGFSLGGRAVTLVGATNRSTGAIELFTLDEGARTLTNVTDGRIGLGVSGEIYGFTIYRSAATGKTYAFAVTKDGWVQQFALSDNGAGRVSAVSVRTFDVGRQSEGMVADDANGWLWVGEEDIGIWRYGADPSAGNTRTQIARVGTNTLRADVEGLALYQTSDGQGYLLASSQGNNSFAVYDRVSGQYITGFSIADGAIDGVSNSDGIEVYSGAVGDFSEGLFIAQDGSNAGANQNFKLVSWGDISRAMGVPLVIDTAAPGNPPPTPEPPPVNNAPAVSAGADAAVTLPATSVALDGTLTDDAVPAAATVKWSVVSAPSGATVTIANAGAVDATATFNLAGTYVFRLLAADAQYTASDTMTLTVSPAPPPVVEPPPTDSTPTISTLQLSAGTDHIAQHKLWNAHGKWWGVLAGSGGTWVYRLDAGTWTGVLKLTNDTSTRADTLAVGDGTVVHALLRMGSSLKLASLQYQNGTYGLWSQRSSIVNLGSVSNMQTATMEMDSTSRLWIAYDSTTTIHARYADGNYSAWGSAVTIASNTSRDEMATIVKLDGRIGIFWSNSNTKRFGFRTHVDGAAATAWTADELPGAGGALNVGSGLADDYLNATVGADGTLYVAVKTNYERTGYTSIGLLVRRPDGTWDPMHTVDTTDSTNPAVVMKGKSLYVIYTTDAGIVYRQSGLGTISFGPRTTLMDGSQDYVTTSRQALGEQLIMATTGGNLAYSAWL